MAGRDRLGRRGPTGARSTSSRPRRDGRDRRPARDHPRDHDRHHRVPARHVTPTFLVGAASRAGARREGDRRRSCVAIGFALLSLVVVALVALPWLAIVGRRDAPRSSGEIVTQRGPADPARPCSGRCSGVAIGTLVQSQVAALVGTLVWIFLGETLLLGLFGVLDIDGAVRLPALPGARRGRRVGRRRPALLLARRSRSRSAGSRLLGAAGIGAHAPPRHHLSATLGRWPRR